MAAELPSATVEALHKTELPDELIERILFEAWRTLAPPLPPKSRNPLLTMVMNRYRWQFYKAIVTTSRGFRRIALEIPFRIAVFRTNGDTQLYQFLLSRYLEHARKEHEDVNDYHCSLFKQCTVVLSWTGNAEDFLSPDNIPAGPYTVLHDSGRIMIPDANAVIIERDSIGPTVEDWIFGLQSLACVHLNLVDVGRPSGPNGLHPSNLSGLPRRIHKLYNNRYLDSSCVRRLQQVEVSGTLPSFNRRASDIIVRTTQLILLTKQSLNIEGLTLLNTTMTTASDR